MIKIRVIGYCSLFIQKKGQTEVCPSHNLLTFKKMKNMNFYYSQSNNRCSPSKPLTVLAS